MDKDRIAGTAKDIKGKVKQGVGEATGDASMEAEGRMDQAEGKVQNKVGQAKDAVRDATDGKDRV
jgi:uncharacterized protein YjbJ (UPF0337 family)